LSSKKSAIKSIVQEEGCFGVYMASESH